MSLPVTATKLLSANPYRLLYSIQNLDATNYIALAHNRQVTAGTFGLHEGQHLTAGQPMSDDTDQGEVWGIANTAACNIAVVEITERPPPTKGATPGVPPRDNPRASALRPKEPRERLAARTF